MSIARIASLLPPEVQLYLAGFRGGSPADLEHDINEDSKFDELTLRLLFNLDILAYKPGSSNHQAMLTEYGKRVIVVCYDQQPDDVRRMIDARHELPNRPMVH